MSLILSSDKHRDALRKMLDEAYVRPDTTPENIVNLVDAARHASQIAFSKDEIHGRPKALHITVRCLGHTLARVLVDGGSALNIIPMTTLDKLPIELAQIGASDTVVRAFDGSKRDVIGEIVLEIEVGPSIFEVNFQVMDIDAAYTLLLGRPWIHNAQAVPSTLHQCVKFIDAGNIITVKGEEHLLISKPVAVPYIDCAEETLEASFHGLELEEKDEGKRVNSVVARIMERHGYQKGRGLGPQLQGRSHPLMLPANEKKLGLGFEYQPGGSTMQKKHTPAQAPTFVLSHVLQPDEMITTLGVRAEGDMSALIRETQSDDLLCNWEAEPIVDVWRRK